MQESGAPAVAVRQAHAADNSVGDTAAPNKAVAEADSAAAEASAQGKPSGKQMIPSAEKSTDSKEKSGNVRGFGSEKTRSNKKKGKAKVVAALEEEPVQAKPKASIQPLAENVQMLLSCRISRISTLLATESLQRLCAHANIKAPLVKITPGYVMDCDVQDGGKRRYSPVPSRSWSGSRPSNESPMMCGT